MSTKTIKRRHSISLETKYEVIKLIEQNMPYSEILSKFKDHLNDISNISKIKKNKDKIITEYESTLSSKIKHIKKSSYPGIDKELVSFVGKCNSFGVPVTNNVLKEKAEKIAEKLNITGFKASVGYLNRFKSRNQVLFEKIHGVATSVSQELCDDWTDTKLPEILKDYEPQNVFNADEFGLFWKLLPQKTYLIKGKSFKSGKMSRDRVSVLVCTNMDGSEKLKPIVIGKYANPRAFKNKKNLPLIYKNNANAWMKSDIFEEFLLKLNQNMQKQNRKIILFIDNCSSHPFITLPNIKIVYFPSNTTSRLQPLDQGVIHSIKANYRRKLTQKLIAIIEDNKIPTSNSIDLYEAIIMLKNAWNEVTNITIQNCFRKSGFKVQEFPFTNDIEVYETISDSIWQELGRGINLENTNVEDFLNCDNNLVAYESTDDNIDSESISNSENNLQEIESSDSETESESNEKPISLLEALNSIKILRQYSAQSDNSEESDALLNSLESIIYKSRFNNAKQSKITDYFK